MSPVCRRERDAIDGARRFGDATDGAFGQVGSRVSSLSGGRQVPARTTARAVAGIGLEQRRRHKV